MNTKISELNQQRAKLLTEAEELLERVLPEEEAALVSAYASEGEKATLALYGLVAEAEDASAQELREAIETVRRKHGIGPTQFTIVDSRYGVGTMPEEGIHAQVLELDFEMLKNITRLCACGDMIATLVDPKGATVAVQSGHAIHQAW